MGQLNIRENREKRMMFIGGLALSICSVLNYGNKQLVSVLIGNGVVKPTVYVAVWAVAIGC
jgi:hypothetical protein